MNYVELFIFIARFRLRKDGFFRTIHLFALYGGRKDGFFRGIHLLRPPCNPEGGFFPFIHLFRTHQAAPGTLSPTPKQKSPPMEDFFNGFLVDDHEFFLEQRAY
jgi:hypothetical protein